MNTVEIMKAKKEDIPIMSEYRYLMFAEMFPDDDFSNRKEKFVQDTKDYYQRHLNDRGQLSVCARSGGEIIGCGTILFQERPPSLKHPVNLTGYILNIYVKADYRRMKVATKVMKALHDEASRQGVHRIGLHASTAGAHVYTKLGYNKKESYLELDLAEMKK
jgi:ribosomal protein S18 acetylase RimI-like enzyme